MHVRTLMALLLLLPASSSGGADGDRLVAISVTDGDTTAVLLAGLAPGAGEGIDDRSGEVELPPAPPRGLFDCRFAVRPAGPLPGAGLTRDLRHGDQTTSAVCVHVLHCRSGRGDTVRIAWDMPPDIVGTMERQNGEDLVSMEGEGARCFDGASEGLSLRIVLHFRPLRLRLRALLEGPYVPGMKVMDTALKRTGILDARFAGRLVPESAVDSIGVEVRRSGMNEDVHIRRGVSAWLMADGSVRDFVDTVRSFVLVDSLPAGPYFIVLRHRNHLAVMSSVPVLHGGGVVEYDFTTAQVQAFGVHPMKGLGPADTTPFGLFAGDANGNGVINASDLVTVWSVQQGRSGGYWGGDLDLNGVVNARDRMLYWRLNNGRAGQVP